MRQWNKVFEIGSPKTGTTSLGKAFEVLGLKHKGWDIKLLKKYLAQDYDEILKVAQKFEAFEDGPWHDPGMYKILDRAFPSSKFILLERDLEDWINSYQKFFSYDNPVWPKEARELRNIQPIRTKAEKEAVIAEHLSRYAEIRDYFRDRPADLLVMNVCEGEGWEKLCPFLDLPIPDKPFPCENQGISFWEKRWTTLKDTLRPVKQKLLKKLRS